MIDSSISTCLPGAYPYWPYTTTSVSVLSPTVLWVAYDRDDVVPFASELEALRYAVDRGMGVKRLSWGEAIAGQLDY